MTDSTEQDVEPADHWQRLIEARLQVVANMAGVSSVLLPDLLRMALSNLGSETTADPRTHRMVLEFVDVAVGMVHDMGINAPRGSNLKRFDDLHQKWHRDNASARTVAWEVSSVKIDMEDAEGVGLAMFTALQGVWQLLVAAYSINERAGRNVDVTLEELIARLALLIQLHREIAGIERNDAVILQLVTAINEVRVSALS
jgi:hypothetical protein